MGYGLFDYHVRDLGKTISGSVKQYKEIKE